MSAASTSTPAWWTNCWRPGSTGRDALPLGPAAGAGGPGRPAGAGDGAPVRRVHGPGGGALGDRVPRGPPSTSPGAAPFSATPTAATPPAPRRPGRPARRPPPAGATDRPCRPCAPPGRGGVSLTLNLHRNLPATDTAADRAAVRRADTRTTWWDRRSTRGRYPATVADTGAADHRADFRQDGDLELTSPPLDSSASTTTAERGRRPRTARRPGPGARPRTTSTWRAPRGGPAHGDGLAGRPGQPARPAGPPARRARRPLPPGRMTENGAANGRLRGPGGQRARPGAGGVPATRT
ncbi:hypothetical protein SCALM49S_05734 [Streptomyces californicus]